jgi:hypothetical protein
MTRTRSEPTALSIRVESAAKFLAAVSAVISAIVLPLFLNSYTEKNRRAELLVRTMTEREKSDTDIRQSMFQSLLTGYLGSLKDDFVKADEESLRRRIMFLELLTVNFQEFFNAKPLFEDVYRRLERNLSAATTDAERKTWTELEAQLIRASSNIVSRQARMLNNIGTSTVFNIAKGERICVRLYDRRDFALLRKRDRASPFQNFDPGPCLEAPVAGAAAGGPAAGGAAGEPRGDTRRQSLEITPLALDKAWATVRVGIYEDVFDGSVFAGSLLKGSISFDISYFDLPYMDNTRMSDGSRFALVLRDVTADAVEIETIRFRNDFVSLRDRPYFEEMLQKLQRGDN